LSHDLKAAIVTKEYPPHVYGGAGVHVQNLVRFLLHYVKAEVHCFGEPREQPEVAGAYMPWSQLDGPEPHDAALRTMSTDLAIAARLNRVDLVHTHTWYANLAGHFAKLIHGIPHVMTSHSLEPLRPWKAEQLGGGYALSCFAERTAIEQADAIIAVSAAMKKDILRCYPTVSSGKVHVIYNGIDPDEIAPSSGTGHLLAHGVESSRPYVLFVGRITRQKGIIHLLDAAAEFNPGVQLVLCAGEPDTPEISCEVETRVSHLQATRGHVIWINRMLEREALSELLTHASVFVCPSVYEPFGIVNLEAMACAVPVVASAVGGIPEIVVPGETGKLVPFENDGSPFGRPRNQKTFASDLARAVNELLDDPVAAKRMGEAGRKRVIEVFSWQAIAQQTAALYRSLCA
jgi:alpha-maltose-1-phosphate synthase